MLSVSIQHHKLAIEGHCFELQLDTSLPVEQGIVGIFGPSGCGKSSLLRCISGLEPYLGAVLWQGEPLESLSAHKRPVCLQGQKGTLFPHLTVEQNLQFILKHSEFKQHSFSIEQVSGWCGIAPLLKRPVSGLSGGESQRVSLARSLLSGKQVILLDEPFSALDWENRLSLLQTLRDIQQQYQVSFVLVSHSLRELAACCEHIVVIEKGQLKQQGNAIDLIGQLSCQQEYHAISVLNAEILSHNTEYGLTELSLLNSEQKIYAHSLPYSEGKNLRLQLEASKVSVTNNQSTNTSALNQLQGVIEQVTTGKHSQLIRVNVDGQVVAADISLLSYQRLGLQAGSKVYLLFKAL